MRVAPSSFIKRAATGAMDSVAASWVTCTPMMAEGCPRMTIAPCSSMKRHALGGEAQGCSNLGNMYRDGRGVPKDDSRAVQLYQRGCAEGNPVGCTNLGFMYEESRVMARDRNRAAQLYQKGCNLGGAQACAKVKRIG